MQTVYGVNAGISNGSDDPYDWQWSNLDVDDPTQLFDTGENDAVSAAVMYHFPMTWMTEPPWSEIDMRIALRPVMDVVYPDGTTETVEGKPVYVYAGSFVTRNTAFGDYGVLADKTNKTLILEYYYDTDAIDLDPEKVLWVHEVDDYDYLSNNNSLYYALDYWGTYPPSSEDMDDLTYIDIAPTVAERDEGGKHYITLTFDLSSMPDDFWSNSDWNDQIFYFGDAYYRDDDAEYFGLWENHLTTNISINQFV